MGAGAVIPERGATVTAAGRNDACPCGSGRKAKRCHLAPGDPPAGTPIILSGAAFTSRTGHWDGRSRCRLRVYLDAGHGDALHAARYLPWLAAQTDLTVVARPALTRLLVASFPDLRIVDRHPIPTTADAHTLSLAILTLASADQGFFPRGPARPYLRAPAPGRVVRAGARLAVGLCARGEPSQRFDRWRSICDEAALALLRAVPGVRWHALDWDDLRRAGVADWADTADLVAGLDAVVTVDTAIAHLAGGLGVPVYLLNRAGGPGDWGPDQRWDEGWLQPGPLYRGLRVFQQRDRADGWGDVIARVVEALARA